MKRKHGDEQPERYIFVVDAVVKHHQFSKEEIKFLKQINLDGFVARVSWGVLHEALVREAVANLEETTMSTTVQGKQLTLLKPDWRAQLQDTFQFTTRKVTTTKHWEMTDFFPSLKNATDGQETVKVADCAYPGAKKPLRMLSSLFCLNTTNHTHISISFAELIVAALNGHTIDWAEEFYQEFYDEIVKLHRKHAQTHVKVQRTTIGPHLTLILKGAGMMNIGEEAEAGFYKDKTDDEDHPKRTRCTNTLVPPVSPQNLQSKVRVVKPRGVTFQRAAPTPSTQDASTSTIFEAEEPWQIPEEVPNIVQQVSQAHRRLENLLTSLSSKAPPKFMRQVGAQFHKVQREALLRKEAMHAKDPSKPSHLQSQVVQLERMEQKLVDAHDLNDMYIESHFELEAQLSEKEVEVQRLLIVHNRDQDELSQLRDQEKAQTQRRASLEQQVQRLTKQAAMQQEEVKELQQTQQQNREELTSLRAENADLRSKISSKAQIPVTCTDSDFGQPTKRPLDKIERHALAEGAANQLLDDLQGQLHAAKQENEELHQKLQQGASSEKFGLPPSYLHPKSECLHTLLEHTAPLTSVMQYYQAYGQLHLPQVIYLYSRRLSD